MILTLIRDACTAVGTLGVLRVADVTVQTLELPWIPNPSGAVGGVPYKSCVPTGQYSLVPHNTQTHPRTFALVNPDLGIIHEPDYAFPNMRYACLLHPANFESQLAGCIAPGLSRQGNCVLDSRAAFAQLMAVVPWTAGHSLIIEASS